MLFDLTVKVVFLLDELCFEFFRQLLFKFYNQFKYFFMIKVHYVLNLLSTLVEKVCILFVKLIKFIRKLYSP